MRATIDYMNARRASKPASGGRGYIVKFNASAERERVAGLDDFERIREAAHARFADMRAADREVFNRIRRGDPANEIPF